jgi:uncharacterized protein (DUF1697 family)
MEREGRDMKRARGGPIESDDAYVALLRGVNVGGKNLLPMQDLTSLFLDAGCRDVRTFLQSGNVLFRAGSGDADRRIERVESAIRAKFGFAAPIILRRVRDLERVERNNPYRQSGADPKALHVVFLREQPSAAAVAALDPNRSVPDSFVIEDREIYLRLSKGVAGTRLTNQYFDSVLKTVSTVRGWSTVLKLLTLAGTPRPSE